ncbi:alanine--tRNA ligase [Limibaculum sp. FT325]|uniref:alanine--tRNA ligase n=1 Tax=Thermohalobaculum sediminis TaxID=2939436 RepID=UPI0020BFDACB|nr:alanine--tRNA ligase [Limibaculum sediminis]MCL5775563.1 alanine--tRNA ligase [Limibaculum sediminis]
MASLNEIRSTFLDYFAKHGHEIVASSPLVPRNDPTLMFTNAGMVQFKNVFTGLEHRDYVRAVTSQKCVRAGGKHNDLDNVGYTARHHTFFEMLGNFSFGDYFKELAIPLAWDLITKEFGLAKDRLLVTVYHDDDEAAGIWKKYAGLPDERIIRIATSDNFWSMGPTGPCGPCSEIFYDHGPQIAGGPPGSPDEDGDRFIEIWNLVFMQFEQFEDGRRESLPRPSIDTGMGLERVGAVLQGKHDNYDTDLMRALIEASAHATGIDPDRPDARVHHRVIADHLRSTSFLIADGVLPSNEGRGYVLRRIMRRAMRHAHLLGADRPVMHRLVPELVRQMGQAFPELGRAQALIAETLELEEHRFRRTLDRGLGLLEDELAALPAGAPLPGETAFKLYDTFGFPLDLTQDALREKGRTVDTAGFDKAMAEQKAKARAAWAGSGEAAEEGLWFDLREEIGATEFLGYDTESAEGVVRAIVSGGARPERLTSAQGEGTPVLVVMNQTPFYAESGGQVGDAGLIATRTGRVRVTDVKKRAGDLFVHLGVIEAGEIVQGEAAELTVASARRAAIRANHSATHLLHEALRGALGDHVAQRGSLVAPDRLRFDFAHTKAMAPDEIRRVEREVNAYIRQNAEVVTRIMTPDEAVGQGARALFGEKYGDEVRVVSMGARPEGEAGPAGRTYSLELCGGTHVARTGEIGMFVVTAEAASAAGIRRVEALTGEAALEHMSAQGQRLGEAASALRARPEEIGERVRALIDERRAMEAEIAALKRRIALGGGGAAGPEAREVGGVRFLGQVLSGINPKDLRGLIDEHKSRLGSGVVVLVADTDGKAAVAAGVTEDLTSRVSAVDLVRAAVEAVGGKGGGGRPDLAQGGGPEGAKAQAAVEAAERVLAG